MGQSAVITGFSGFVTNEAPEGGTLHTSRSTRTALGGRRRPDQRRRPGRAFAGPEDVHGAIGPDRPGLRRRRRQRAAAQHLPRRDVGLRLSIYLPTAPRRSTASAPARSGAVRSRPVGPPEFGGNPGSVWRVDGATGRSPSPRSTRRPKASPPSAAAFDPTSNLRRRPHLRHHPSLHPDGVEQGTRPWRRRPPAGGPVAASLYAGSAGRHRRADLRHRESATWGFAPPARRVFWPRGPERPLYYSVAQGPQVCRSASRRAAPSAATRASDEFLPPGRHGIASITFDGQGRMYLAERGSTTGDFELTDLAYGGASRVLRYLPKPPGAPIRATGASIRAVRSACRRPTTTPMAALPRLRLPARRVDEPGHLPGTVWSTGERLLDPGDPSAPPVLSGPHGIRATRCRCRARQHAAFGGLIYRLRRPARQPGIPRLYGRDRDLQPVRRGGGYAPRRRHPAADDLPAGHVVCRRPVRGHGRLPAEDELQPEQHLRLRRVPPAT